MNKDKPCILIADDEAHLRELLVSIFARQGFNAIGCEDGEKLIGAIAQTPHIAAIVSDLLLPFVEGFDLVTQIRRHPHSADVPLILLTDLADESVVVEAFRHRVNEVMSKPFQPRELVARVQRWQGQPPLPPLKESL